MGAPLQIPRWARRPLSIGVATTLARTGWAISPVTTGCRSGRRAATLLRHSGFMMPNAETAVVERAVAGVPDHARCSGTCTSPAPPPATTGCRLAGSGCPPSSWPAASTSSPRAEDMRTASERIPGSTYVELRGSHFLQMERPADVHRQLLAFLAAPGCSEPDRRLARVKPVLLAPALLLAVLGLDRAARRTDGDPSGLGTPSETPQPTTRTGRPSTPRASPPPPPRDAAGPAVPASSAPSRPASRPRGASRSCPTAARWSASATRTRVVAIDDGSGPPGRHRRGGPPAGRGRPPRAGRLPVVRRGPAGLRLPQHRRRTTASSP